MFFNLELFSVDKDKGDKDVVFNTIRPNYRVFSYEYVGNISNALSWADLVKFHSIFNNIYLVKLTKKRA